MWRLKKEERRIVEHTEGASLGSSSSSAATVPAASSLGSAAGNRLQEQVVTNTAAGNRLQKGLNAPPIQEGSFAAGNRLQTATLEADPAVVDARMVAIPEDTLQHDLSAMSLDDFISSDHPELNSRDIENRLLRQELASLKETLMESQAAADQTSGP